MSQKSPLVLDYETPSNKSGVVSISNLARLFCCSAGLGWLYIFDRLCIFVFDYHCQRWMNHIDDRDFASWYRFYCYFALLVIPFSAWIIWKGPGRWRIMGFLALAANPAAILTLFLMHKYGILVGYSEAQGIGG